jgi:serine/threonine protein kinase
MVSHGQVSMSNTGSRGWVTSQAAGGKMDFEWVSKRGFGVAGWTGAVHPELRTSFQLVPHQFGSRFGALLGLYSIDRVPLLSQQVSDRISNLFGYVNRLDKAARIRCPSRWDHNATVLLKAQRVYSMWHEHFYREIQIWTRLARQPSSPVPKLYLAWIAGEVGYTVSQCIPNSHTLNRWLREHPACVQLGDLVRIFESIAWLHYHRVIHGDLHGDNILVELDSQHRMRRHWIIDFGQAMEFETRATLTVKSEWADTLDLMEDLFQFTDTCPAIAILRQSFRISTL